MILIDRKKGGWGYPNLQAVLTLSDQRPFPKRPLAPPPHSHAINDNPHDKYHRAATQRACAAIIRAEKKRRENRGEAPRQAAPGLLVELGCGRRQAASDFRKHVIGAAADQFDRANHDHQDYREHDRVFGDVLTTFLSPKSMDCLDHCLLPQSTTRPSWLIPWGIKLPSCDRKIPQTGPLPNSTPVPVMALSCHSAEISHGSIETGPAPSLETR